MVSAAEHNMRASVFRRCVFLSRVSDLVLKADDVRDGMMDLSGSVNCRGISSRILDKVTRSCCVRRVAKKAED